MKKAKRILSCAVALASAMSLYTAPVSAEDPGSADNPAQIANTQSASDDSSGSENPKTPVGGTAVHSTGSPKISISAFSPKTPTLTPVKDSERVFHVTAQKYIEYSLKAIGADSDILISLAWTSEEGGPSIDPEDYQVDINGENVTGSEGIAIRRQEGENSRKAVLVIPASLLDPDKPSTIRLAFRAIPSNDPARTALNLTSSMEYAEKAPRVSGEYNSAGQTWDIKVRLAEKPEFIRLILDKKGSELLGNPALFKLDDLSISAEVKKDAENGTQTIWIPQSLAQSAKAGSVLTFKIPVHPDSAESKSSSVSLTVEDGHVSKKFKAKISTEPGAQPDTSNSSTSNSSTSESQKPGTPGVEGSDTSTPGSSTETKDPNQTGGDTGDRPQTGEGTDDTNNTDGTNNNGLRETPGTNSDLTEEAQKNETAPLPDTTADITRDNGVTTVTQQLSIPVDQIIRGQFSEDGSTYTASVHFQNYTPQQLSIDVESYPAIFNTDAAAVLVNGSQLPAELYTLNQNPLENGAGYSVNLTPAGLAQLDPNAQVDVVLETAPVDASSLNAKLAVNNGAYIARTDTVHKNETGTEEEGEKPESNGGVNEETAPSTSKPFKAQHQYDSDKQTWTVNLTLLRKPQKLVMTFDQQQGTALGKPTTMTLNGENVSPSIDTSGSKYTLTFSAADVARMDKDSKIQLVFPISSTVEQTEKIVMNVDDGNGNKNYSATFRVVRSASGTSNNPKRSDGTSTSTNTGLITTVVVLVAAAAAFIVLAFLSRKNRKKNSH